MDVSELLKRIRLDFHDLARISGVSHGYIRLLSSKNRMAGPDTRRKLAVALRAHARQLEEDAERLENAED
jgi:hypothetical protein